MAPELASRQADCKTLAMREEMSTAEAGVVLGVTAQTIRQWCEVGKLKARRAGERRVWRVDRASVDSLVALRPQPTAQADLAIQIRDLRVAVDRLRSDRSADPSLVAALERERDHYRGESAAVREAALLVNSAARETSSAVRHLIDVLEQQSAALEQLLAPSTPFDVLG